MSRSKIIQAFFELVKSGAEVEGDGRLTTSVQRAGSIQVDVGGEGFGVPYYCCSDLDWDELPEDIELPDDLGRPHANHNVIDPRTEPNWNPEGVAKRFKVTFVEGGDDMFLIGDAKNPGGSTFIAVYTAPPKGDIV